MKEDKDYPVGDLRWELNRALISNGLESLREDDFSSALSCFDKAYTMSKNPLACSYLAFCMAKLNGEIDKALSLCREAIKDEPANPTHYLNLGRIYLLAGNKSDAIKAFSEGLGRGNSPEISDEMNILGTRKEPLVPFLKRSNPVNKYLGIILKKLKLR